MAHEGSDPAAAGGDWRAQLQPEERSRAVHKMMETLQKYLPVSVPEGLNEFQKIAVQFEEKIYTAATNHSDYLRKISRKLLSMAPVNAQVISNQNNPGQGTIFSKLSVAHFIFFACMAFFFASSSAEIMHFIVLNQRPPSLASCYLLAYSLYRGKV
ncbi:hypothetical protein ACQ4PT_005643 [Festuca glaucescens]